jgi:hypothetical protein
VANENYVAQLLPPYFIYDVEDMGVQIDVGTEQVRPFAQASQGGRKNGVVLGGKQFRDAFPAPPAVPSAMYKHIIRHFVLPSPRTNILHATSA